MPLMRLAATALDRVRPRREAIVDEVVAYAATDLLCYRAHGPVELVLRQKQVWQPVLDWLRRRYDAHLQVTSGISPIAQGEASLARLRAVVTAQDDLHLTALQALTATLSSLALALALQEGELSPEAAFAASQLDESFQIERWGADEEAMLRREEIREEIVVTARFLALLRA
jgi:chaperone required for assembly of F1-ATPase